MSKPLECTQQGGSFLEGQETGDIGKTEVRSVDHGFHDLQGRKGEDHHGGIDVVLLKVEGRVGAGDQCRSADPPAGDDRIAHVRLNHQGFLGRDVPWMKTADFHRSLALPLPPCFTAAILPLRSSQWVPCQKTRWHRGHWRNSRYCCATNGGTRGTASLCEIGARTTLQSAQR